MVQKINNGRLDVFANWDMCHVGQKASTRQSLNGTTVCVKVQQPFDGGLLKTLSHCS